MIHRTEIRQDPISRSRAWQPYCTTCAWIGRTSFDVGRARNDALTHARNAGTP